MVGCSSSAAAPLMQALHAWMSPESHHMSQHIQGGEVGRPLVHHKSIHRGPWRRLLFLGLTGSCHLQLLLLF